MKQQQENKKCGNESCECTSKKDEQTLVELTAVANVSQNKKEDKILDPTHFGDWQVNCRTIDF